MRMAKAEYLELKTNLLKREVEELTKATDELREHQGEVPGQGRDDGGETEGPNHVVEAGQPAQEGTVAAPVFEQPDRPGGAGRPGVEARGRRARHVEAR